MKQFFQRLFCLHDYEFIRAIERDTPPIFLYVIKCRKCEKIKVTSVLNIRIAG